MSTSATAMAHALIDAFMAKDSARVAALFADDGLLVDPHYPQPAIQGKDAIAASLDVMYQFLVQPRFTLRKFWQADESFAVEVDTHHTFADGSEVQFPQVIVVDLAGDRIKRAQIYTPYPPPPQT